jgi:hypothetical protein
VNLLNGIRRSNQTTPADREAMRTYLRERMRVWKPEEQEPFTRCADIMLYLDQFGDSPKIVQAWMVPATNHMRQANSTWLQRVADMTVPREAVESHELFREIFASGERWASAMVALMQLAASGVPRRAQREARTASRLYEKHRQARMRSERETRKLGQRFALVAD